MSHPMCEAGAHDYVKIIAGLEHPTVLCSRCGKLPDQDEIERAFKGRSTGVQHPFKCELVREPHFENWTWKFENGSSRPASMTEVLLWEILQVLHGRDR